MKILIVENLGGSIYVYTETPNHYALLLHNGERNMANNVPFSETDNECNMLMVLDEGQWMSTIMNP